MKYMYVISFTFIVKLIVKFIFLQRKHHLMKELLSPIASKFESLLSKLHGETDEKRQYAYAQSINMATSLARYMIGADSEVNVISYVAVKRFCW